MNAFVQHDLPDFEPTADYTVSAWILSGKQGCIAMALCIECVELPHSLLCIGEWGRDGRLQAVVHHGGSIWMRGKSGSLPREQWLHVAVTQSRDQLSLYINGRLEDSTKWKAQDSEIATRVRAVLSRLREVISDACGDAGTNLPWTLRSRVQTLRPMGRGNRKCQVLESHIRRSR
jgi:hypothetical protein